MSGKYWNKAWSLVDGCTPVSAGCENCWSKAMAERFHRWPEKVTPRWDRLEIPRKVKKSTVWAVWNDLFHEDVPADLIHRALYVMMNCPQHTFLVLTKRAKRMYEWFNPPYPPKTARIWKWPLDNLWLGVTAENQEMADKRIPILLQIPAAKRFVSIEPMLGPVDLGISQCTCPWPIDAARTRHLLDCPADIRRPESPYKKWLVDWIVQGGETGPNVRPMHPDWVKGLRDQCQAAGVPFWFKQWGEWLPISQIPKGSLVKSKKSISMHSDGEISGKLRKIKNTNLSVGGEFIYRVGRKKAGRLLDGREWNERPETGEQRVFKRKVNKIEER
jgi:protein gp37